jgi:tripeptide aminopeptidase
MSRFARLCEIASPTGEERAVADAVRAELESFGLEVEEDDAAGPAGAGAGNLFCRIPGVAPGFVMIASHLDTVPHEGPIEVVLEDGIYASGGDTILGADNKAAVTVMVELASRYSQKPPPIGIELLFTVAEEQGLRGAAAFDTSKLHSAVSYVLDHATDIGEVITAAPSLHQMTAEFQVSKCRPGAEAAARHRGGGQGNRLDGTRPFGEGPPPTWADRGGTSTNVIPGVTGSTVRRGQSGKAAG